MARERASTSDRPRRRRDAWRGGTANLFAVLVVYFAVPADTSRPLLAAAWSAVAVAAVVVVGRIVLREMRRAAADEHRRLQGLHLVLALEIVVVGFATIYYLLGRGGTEQLVGLETRLDALYFAAVTTTTVGYGDVAPVGQLARAVVTTHLLFNLVFIAALTGLLRGSVGRPPDPPHD